MSVADIEALFTWIDVVEDGKWAGCGWLQSCDFQEDSRLQIICRATPGPADSPGMRLTITTAGERTVIDYLDSGGVLHEYVTRTSFPSVLNYLRKVRSPQVHLAAAELLETLESQRLLARVQSVQRTRRGQITH